MSNIRPQDLGVLFEVAMLRPRMPGYPIWEFGGSSGMARSSRSLPKGKGHYKLKAKRKAKRLARRLNR